MSTDGMTGWAVYLKDVGAIFPFQGTEVLLVIVGRFFDRLAILQTGQESAEIDSDMKADSRGE